MCSNHAKGICLVQVQISEDGLADARRIRQHRLEHGLKFARRRADDAQYLGGRRLLLQRLPQFIEQPRVLDGDYGLGGEVRHQRYLLLGGWCNLLEVNSDKADYFRVPEHRDAKQSANPATSAAATGSGSPIR